MKYIIDTQLVAAGVAALGLIQGKSCVGGKVGFTYLNVRNVQIGRHQLFIEISETV